MNKGSIKVFDKSNMFDTLSKFPDQIRDACKIGESLENEPLNNSDDILISGMGGSAIAGNLLANYASNTEGAKHLNIKVNRDYSVPESVNSETLAIISSYSGNTEETISAYHELDSKTKKIAIISTGGKAEKLAKASNQLIIKLPTGYQPREAIALSFFTQLYYLMFGGSFKASAIQLTASGINELLKVVDKSTKEFSVENPENPAFAFAQEVKGKVPVVYSSPKYEAINYRFRGQFHENSKIPAFGSLLPEMNHNEINSLENTDLNKGFHFIIIKDSTDHPRTLKRFDFLENLLKSKGYSYSVIQPSSKSLISKYFELISYADWTSYWLALILGKDPTEINTISGLKEFMSK